MILGAVNLEPDFEGSRVYALPPRAERPGFGGSRAAAAVTLSVAYGRLQPAMGPLIHCLIPVLFPGAARR